MGTFLLVYPLSQAAFILFTSVFFRAESTAHSTNAFFHAVLGMVCPAIVLALRDSEHLEILGIFLCYVFNLVPSFSVVYGIYAIEVYDNLYVLFDQ